ncbi:hypothetical protein K3495_g4382, partial [Podosphaera aphanis]
MAGASKALLEVLEANIDNISYIKWLIEKKEWTFDMSPLTCALKGAGNLKVEELQPCLINFIDALGAELDHMLNEFNRVQSENKGMAVKLDDTNLRLQKSETALEKTRNALLNSQESLSELVSQNTKLVAKSMKTRTEK